MPEQRIDSRSGGVLCIAGGYGADQDATSERTRAFIFATATYERFTFVLPEVVETPEFLLSGRRYLYRQLLLEGLRRGVNRQGFEKIIFFGSRVTEFMLVAVAESRLRQKPLSFYAQPDSSLERYGRFFSRRKQNAWAAYLQAEKTGLIMPG